MIAVWLRRRALLLTQGVQAPLNFVTGGGNQLGTSVFSVPAPEQIVSNDNQIIVGSDSETVVSNDSALGTAFDFVTSDIG